MLHKKAILKNFAKSQEAPTLESISKKLQTFRPATLLKRDPNAGVFLRIHSNFYTTYFEKHLQTTAFYFFQWVTLTWT